jgi:hypothetical protein
MNADRLAAAHRELIYLALLCQSRSTAPLRSELERLLHFHSWQSEDHRAVFEALAGWRTEPEFIRAELPARLTRLGFPDIDTDCYFVPAEASLETALRWLRDERTAAAGRTQFAQDRAAHSE